MQEEAPLWTFRGNPRELKDSLRVGSTGGLFDVVHPLQAAAVGCVLDVLDTDLGAGTK